MHIFETMRTVFLFILSVLWLSRLGDPVVHSLLHDHHEHCAEQGLHLHEGDDSCQWTDPAYLLGLQPVSIGWELAPRTSRSAEPLAHIAAAKNSDVESPALRGPPLG
jgi:hypothetical protein